MSIFFQVEDTEDLQRMFAVPTRKALALDSPEAVQLAHDVTNALALTASPWPGRLHPIQALALKEAFDNNGLLALIRTGGGKMLLSALLFTVLKAERPMLIVPASMLQDTKRNWKKLEQHWRILPLEAITLISYEKCSVPSSGAKLLPDGTVAYPDLITRHRPDVVVMDEVHRVSNTGGAGVRRLGRYLAEFPSTKVCGLTGTFIRKSVKDGAHIAEWILHDRSPLPTEFKTLEPIADATDARTASPGKRTEFGALLGYLSAPERREYDAAESMDDARAVVSSMLGRRILSTSGVITSTDDPLQIPARLDPVYPGRQDPVIDQEIMALIKGDGERAAWTLPNGDLLPDTKALARHLITVSLGMYLLQDPPPPPEYRGAASAWNGAVRDIVKYRPELALDSEALVRYAVQRGALPELSGTLQEWLDAQAAYSAATGLREPPSVPTWISNEAVDSVKAWLAEGPGFVWCQWRALGHKLSAELGLPYYAGGKRDANGVHVTDHPTGQSAIMSMASVGTGTDTLQVKGISRNLWMCAPTEQSLGRVHRLGFEGEVVINDVYLPSSQHITRFWRGVEVSGYAGRMSGYAQKLLYFQNNVPRDPPESGARWGIISKGDEEIDADG